MNSRLDDLRQNVSSHADDPRAHFELGCAAQMHGDLELALKCFVKVTELAETVAVGHFNLGNVYFTLKRWQLAVAAFQRAFQLSPDRSTLNNLGNAWAAMGDFGQAITQYELALTFPDDGTGRFRVLKNLGMARQADGDWLGATSAYQQAIEEPADTSAVFLQLARLLAQTDFEQAMLALASHPDLVQQSPELLTVRADCLTSQNAMAEALKCLSQASALAPEQPTVIAGFGRHYLRRGRHFEALVCLHRALSGGALTQRIHSAWLTSQLYQEPIDWLRFKHEAERWSEIERESTAGPETGAAAVAPRRDLDADAMLHLGIVGGSVAYHKLSVFLQPLIARAGAENYRLSLYVDGDPWKDDPNDHMSLSGSARATTQASPNVRWIDTRWLGDNRLSRRIQSDGVDVLIDLTGHADDGRLGVFARRSAPLQISWAGWLATTGMQAMDCVLGDETTILDSEQAGFTEGVLRLTSCMFCALPLKDVDALPTQSVRVSERGQAILGSVCSPTQLTDKLIGTWCKLLRQLPDARLLISDPAYRDGSLAVELAERFRAREVAVERIELVVADDMQAFLQSIDVLLDPFPWNRAEVTCQSLCLGTPVVTWLGDRLSSRTSASVLKAAGLSEWIAESPDAYWQLALRLVQDRIAPTELRSRIMTSSLCDADAWVRNFIAQVRSQYHRCFHESLR